MHFVKECKAILTERRASRIQEVFWVATLRHLNITGLYKRVWNRQSCNLIFHCLLRTKAVENVTDIYDYSCRLSLPQLRS